MATMPRHRSLRTALLLPLLLALALGLAACSPEAARDFGGGRDSGADVGNRDDDVEMHPEEEREDRIYYRTPDDLPPVAADESG